MSSSTNNSTSEIDRLDPVSEVITLLSGLKVKILPLKMRQLFRLLRIVTRGGAAYLPMLRDTLLLSGDDNAAEVFGTQLMAIAIIALPEAEDEAVAFIQSVVEPCDLVPGRDKQAKERNAVLRTELDDELSNPEPEDVISILETVIAQEKDDLVALGKRVGAMFKVALTTVDLQAPATVQPVNQPSQSGSTVLTPALSEPLPEPVTVSPQNTGGQMSASSALVSAG